MCQSNISRATVDKLFQKLKNSLVERFDHRLMPFCHYPNQVKWTGLALDEFLKKLQHKMEVSRVGRDITISLRLFYDCFAFDIFSNCSMLRRTMPIFPISSVSPLNADPSTATTAADPSTATTATACQNETTAWTSMLASNTRVSILLKEFHKEGIFFFGSISDQVKLVTLPRTHELNPFAVQVMKVRPNIKRHEINPGHLATLVTAFLKNQHEERMSCPEIAKIEALNIIGNSKFSFSCLPSQSGSEYLVRCSAFRSTGDGFFDYNGKRETELKDTDVIGKFVILALFADSDR